MKSLACGAVDSPQSGAAEAAPVPPNRCRFFFSPRSGADGRVARVVRAALRGAPEHLRTAPRAQQAGRDPLLHRASARAPRGPRSSVRCVPPALRARRASLRRPPPTPRAAAAARPPAARARGARALRGGSRGHRSAARRRRPAVARRRPRARTGGRGGPRSTPRRRGGSRSRSSRAAGATSTTRRRARTCACRAAPGRTPCCRRSAPPARSSRSASRVPAPWRLDDLEREGMVDAAQAGALRAAVLARRNVLVCGPAGSGKTSLLAALMAEVPAGERIVTVEDVAELAIDHPHVVGLEARQPNTDGVGGIGLTALVRETLRMRPDRIVVGECRGAEIAELLGALNTGHDGGAGTVHCADPDGLGARLEALGALAGLSAAALRAQALAAIDVVVLLGRRDGVRRVERIGRARRARRRLARRRVIRSAARAPIRRRRRTRSPPTSTGSERSSGPGAAQPAAWAYLPQAAPERSRPMTAAVASAAAAGPAARSGVPGGAGRLARGRCGHRARRGDRRAARRRGRDRRRRCAPHRRAAPGRRRVDGGPDRRAPGSCCCCRPRPRCSAGRSASTCRASCSSGSGSGDPRRRRRAARRGRALEPAADPGGPQHLLDRRPRPRAGRARPSGRGCRCPRRASSQPRPRRRPAWSRGPPDDLDAVLGSPPSAGLPVVGAARSPRPTGCGAPPWPWRASAPRSWRCACCSRSGCWCCRRSCVLGALPVGLAVLSSTALPL